MSPDNSLVVSLTGLAQCESEPIHVPGSIQPHGVLLALYGPTLRIIQVSSNCQSLLGIRVESLLERELTTAVDSALAEAVRVALANYQELPDAPAMLNWVSPISQQEFAVQVHLCDQVVMLELEPAALPLPQDNDLLARAARVLGLVRAKTELGAKTQLAADWLRRLTGYDRVMIYRFHEDWHGEVIAEAHRADLVPYLGLHYPASDIPAQARQLYMLNPTRVIADVDYVPAPLLPAVNPVSGLPLDLSRSVLRSASPVHLQYLRNMGVRATLVSALFYDDRLWGLISCHHCSPYPVSASLRGLVNWMAQDLATQIGVIQEAHGRRYAARLKQCRDNIIAAMRQGSRLPALLTGPALVELLAAVAAEGAALVHGTDIVTGGVTPPPLRIAEIVKQLTALPPMASSPLFVTDCLSEHLPQTADLAASAAGMGMFPLDAAHSMKLLWFRGEQLRLVKWGGNPDKAMLLTPDGQLSPRKSFAEWTQSVQYRSARWLPEDIESARELGSMVDIELRRIAEDALRESEVLRRDVLDSLSAHIAVIDSGGVIESVNRAWRQFAEMNGGGQECHPGANYLAVCRQVAAGPDCEDAQTALTGIRNVLSGRSRQFSMEYPCDSATEPRWFAMRVYSLSGPKPGVVIAHEDITVSKQAEIILRKSEARFRVLFESHNVMMMLVDPNDGAIVDANPAAARFYGYDRSALRGMNVSALNHKPIKELRQGLDAAKRSGESSFVFPYHQEDLSTRMLEISGTLVEVEGRQLLFCIVQDITARHELDRQLAEKQAQLAGLNQSLEHRIHSAVAELRAKDQLLISQNRQAAMGEMIGNIAHQWRQPLNALGLLLSNIQDAHEYGELDGLLLARSVSQGKHLIQRMSITINDFRNFFRPEKERVAFSVQTQLAQTTALVGASFRHHGITIEIEAQEDVKLWGLPNEYSQVLLNLLVNARDAILAQRVSAGWVKVSIAIHNREGLVLVRDNGGGISDDIIERIFDPFFSTREAGTGIGLYMSKMIIERSMGGHIEVRNFAGGAEFSVFCPLAEEGQ